MAVLSRILGSIATAATTVISTGGYAGIFFLMMLESMIVPLPSELVLPFAGFLAAQGRFSFALIVVFATLGSLAGSLISYYMGLYGGEPLVRRFGKYLLLDDRDLDATERWFRKRGSATVFFSRFIPVVRHIISIPAGMGRMDLRRFMLFTVAGAALWNAFLIYLGYLLGQNWEAVRAHTEWLSVAVVVLIVITLVAFVIHHWHRRRKL